MIKSIATPLLFVITAAVARAEPVAVSAVDIRALLSGNSAIGTWSGTPYKQYFSETGLTIYAADGSSPSRGKWRVNEQTNRYESWWEQTGWSEYGVLREGDAYFWTARGIDPQPFRVVEGDQLK
ncbi:MAG: hypothetical protein OXR62_00605 [Ahrensia sp.]|nr:hypothetical protein [Ahrensia sp.]